MSIAHIKKRIIGVDIMKSVFTMNGKELIDFMSEYIRVTETLVKYKHYTEENVLLEIYSDSNDQFLNNIVFPNINIYISARRVFYKWISMICSTSKLKMRDHMERVAVRLFEETYNWYCKDGKTHLPISDKTCKDIILAVLEEDI
jgi:hypothetical protein